MARKSRKHPGLAVSVNKDTVGYIRLSVLNRKPHGSVENQRLMIEEWGYQHQLPIMRYYINSSFSGKRFDRLTFQEMLQVMSSSWPRRKKRQKAMGFRRKSRRSLSGKRGSKSRRRQLRQKKDIEEVSERRHSRRKCGYP